MTKGPRILVLAALSLGGCTTTNAPVIATPSAPPWVSNDWVSRGPGTPPPPPLPPSKASLALARIAERDGQLHAVIAVSPKAIEEGEVKRGWSMKPDVETLFGHPILLKDNIETRDQPTTAGSLALAGNNTGRDAPIVTRLRAAGAVILGKSNLSEWANIRSNNSISGWSAVGGHSAPGLWYHRRQA